MSFYNSPFLKEEEKYEQSKITAEICFCMSRTCSHPGGALYVLANRQCLPDVTVPHGWNYKPERVIVFAILFAAILQRGKFKGKNFFRVIFYIPNILSIVVIGGIFGAIYDPSNGLLNTFLEAVHLDFLTHKWMGEPKIVIYSIIFALVWQAIGYYMVMYMSGMSAIPEDLYEAASLDGSSEINTFFTVTLPLIWTNIRTTLTFYIISTINLSFLFVQIMTDGGPNGKTEVFLNYMYKQAYGNGAYGYGMAIGVVVFIFSFVLAAIVNKITDREVYEM